MEQSPRRDRWLWFLLVCLLHGVLGWLLIIKSRVIPQQLQPSSYELILIAPTRGAIAPSSTKMMPQPTRSRSIPQTNPRVVDPEVDTGSSLPNNALTPSVDWNAELSRAGRAASGLDSQSPKKDFGFPTKPPTMADYPQFDWDYARTHRVESIPEGGVVINLNDNCVLVMNPFPFPFCSPFKRKANGELFKHMRDPDKPGDAAP